jgi:serine/threonine protein kinase
MHGEETQARTTALRAGDEFADHRIEGVLGQGGMGVVYRATDLRLNRAVALKVIKPELSQDEDFRRRFRRESELAASVRQPNVVTIYQAGDADGLLFVTMDLIDGVDLRAVRAQHGRLDAVTAGEMVAQVAAALDAAHACGLVHRDVKPANILVADGTPLHVYLTDFGLTKRTSSQTGITQTGLFVGTLDYAAPEQITGGAVDARTDVYALGCVLYEMLTGRPPFRRDHEAATIYAQINEPAPAPSAAAPGVPAAFDDVVLRALAKDPDDRFPSAGDLARAALAAAHGEHPTEPERTVAIGPAAPPPPMTVQAPPPPPPAPPTYVETPPSYATAALPQAERSRSALPIVVLIVALVLIAGAIAAVLITRDDGNSNSNSAAPVAQQPQRQKQQRQAPPPADTALRADVTAIGAILDLSAEGRAMTADGDFQGAALNRREVLTKIEALDADPQLAESQAVLHDAIDASLDSNVAHRNCGDCAAARAADTRATTLKAQFVRKFNPFAERYLQRSYDPSQI